MSSTKRDAYRSAMARKREYERIARSLEAQLDTLDPDDDPDHRNSARHLMQQLTHAENMAAEAERYAMRAKYDT